MYFMSVPDRDDTQNANNFPFLPRIAECKILKPVYTDVLKLYEMIYFGYNRYSILIDNSIFIRISNHYKIQFLYGNRIFI